MKDTIEVYDSVALNKNDIGKQGFFVWNLEDYKDKLD